MSYIKTDNTLLSDKYQCTYHIVCTVHDLCTQRNPPSLHVLPRCLKTASRQRLRVGLVLRPSPTSSHYGAGLRYGGFPKYGIYVVYGGSTMANGD